MEQNCSQLPAGEADVERRSPSKPRLEFEEVGKLSPNDRAESPDSNCAICLGKLQNKSFTDSCLHQFCFTCLLEWSKVKAECPLCKQSFKSIIHNVRSIEDYDQYHLRQPEPRIAMQNFPYSFIDDTQPRFRYRTTMAPAPPPLFGYLQRLEHMMSHAEIIPPGLPHYLVHPRRQWRSGSHTNGSSTSNISGRRPRVMSPNFPEVVVGTSSFRRNIYNNNLWVRRVPDLTGRFRECSAEFFLNNPAQIHRLVPWLNRELNVLLAGTDHQTQVQEVVAIILELLPRHNIRSQEFRNALLPYLGNRVVHFVHEFYAFGTSPFDMVGYDRICLYGPPFNFSDDDFSDSSSDSDIQVVDVVRSETNTNTSTNVSSYEIPHPDVELPVAGPSHAPDNQSLSLIAVSSEMDSDTSDCQIVGSVKPRHLRTPEVITLDSDSDSGVDPSNTVVVGNISSEESDVDRKPSLIALEKSGRPSLYTRSKADQRNRCNGESSRRSMRVDTLSEMNRRRSYPKTSSSSSWHDAHDFNPSSLPSLSSSSFDNSDEDWDASRKSASRKHKKEKRKRSVSSKKKVKESDKKKKGNKEKKSKPIRHWKKKLCNRKIESSSSSEEMMLRNNKKRKLILHSSGDSQSDDQHRVDHDYINPYSELHQKRGHSSRLKSVVHVKHNPQEDNDSQSLCRSCHSSTPSRETDRGPSTSSGITSHYSADYDYGANCEDGFRAHSSRQNRSPCSSLSSPSSPSSSSSYSSSSYSSSSVVFTPCKKNYRKVKSKRKHV